MDEVVVNHVRRLIRSHADGWEKDADGQMLRVPTDKKDAAIKDEWCLKNLKGEFFYLDSDLFEREYNGGKTVNELTAMTDKIIFPVIHKVYWLFQYQEDAALFKLTWG